MSRPFMRRVNTEAQGPTSGEATETKLIPKFSINAYKSLQTS
jgi:hypothetical protein